MAVINESGNRIRNGNGNPSCGGRFHKHKKPISITFSIPGECFCWCLLQVAT